MNIIVGLGLLLIANANELVGFLLPPVVDYLTKDVPDENERFIVSCVLCILCAVLIKWNYLLVGTPDEVAKTAGLIFFQSQVIFKLYFKNSFLRKQIAEKLYDGDMGTDEKMKVTTSSTLPAQ